MDSGIPAPTAVWDNATNLGIESMQVSVGRPRHCCRRILRVGDAAGGRVPTVQWDMEE